MTDKPFAGCIAALEGLIDDGTIDRFNDFADARNPTRDKVLSFYQDGSYLIQRERDAEIAAGCEPDYVGSVPVPVLLDLLKREGLGG